MKRYLLTFWVLFLTLTASYSQINLTQGLVAYYPFNGNTGDSSGNANHVTVNNNATLTTDRFGHANSAYLFDGNSSYMKVPSSASLNTGAAISICAWVKVNGFYAGTCQSNRMINKGDADNIAGVYSLAFGTQNGCSQTTVDSAHEYFVGYGSPVLTNYVQKNSWYFVVYTSNGTTAQMYVNGVLQGSASIASYTFSNAYDLYFGKINNTSTSYWFNGALDDIRIYNRAITQDEVSALYTPTLTGLVAWYPFNGNTGDSSGYANHVTVNNNATLTSDRFGHANSAYLFDGTSSYMKVPTSVSLNTGAAISISAWVKVNGFYAGPCQSNRILNKGDMDNIAGIYSLAYGTYNGCLQSTVDSAHEYFVGYGSPVLTNYVQKSAWYFIMYTSNGTSANMYVNGVLQGSGSISSYTFSNAYDLYLGKMNNITNPYWFNGVLDDVRIYNRALAATEITALYTPASTTLPVVLTDFYANKKGADAIINWDAATEINHAYYDLERSFDGTSFSAITRVAPNTFKNYTYSDLGVFSQSAAARIYYRLKMVSNDASVTYSPVISVNGNKTSSIEVLTFYPNPFSNKVSLQINSTLAEQLNFTITDMNGKVVYAANKRVVQGYSLISLEGLSKLAKGVYALRIISSNNTVIQKIIKE